MIEGKYTVIANSHDHPGTFVASNTFSVLVHCNTEVCPLIMDKGLVGGAETSPGRC